MVLGVYRFEWYALTPTCGPGNAGSAPLLRTPELRGPVRAGRARLDGETRSWTDLPPGHVLHDFLLAGKRGLFPAVDVAVALCGEERDEVDARPRALALQLPVRSDCSSACWSDSSTLRAPSSAPLRPPDSQSGGSKSASASPRARPDEGD